MPLTRSGRPEGFDALEVYTTRPDTLLGASFAAISPDHPLAKALEARDPAIAAFVAECRKGGTTAEAMETAEKLGMDCGVRVRHPLGSQLGTAGLYRELHPDGLWHGRDLWLPGA